MARPLRIEYPGAFYHIISRGNEKKNIFADYSDYKKFLGYLKDIIDRYRVKIHAYCLMENHYHLILETPEGNLVKAIHNLNSSYTAYFNTKYKRAGHLFQGRYKSLLVQAEEYLYHLSRYIHLNPVKANKVKLPEHYPWSSYRHFIEDKPVANNIVTTEFILSNFNSDIKKARILYKKFVEESVEESTDIIEKNTVGGFILANQDFVEWVKNTFLQENIHKEIPQTRILKEIHVAPVTPQQIQNLVNKTVRDGKLAKKFAIYFSRKFTNRTLEEIAAFFENISDAGISKIYHRIKSERKSDKSLNQQLTELEKLICNK